MPLLNTFLLTEGWFIMEDICYLWSIETRVILCNGKNHFQSTIWFIKRSCSTLITKSVTKIKYKLAALETANTLKQNIFQHCLWLSLILLSGIAYLQSSDSRGSSPLMSPIRSVWSLSLSIFLFLPFLLHWIEKERASDLIQSCHVTGKEPETLLWTSTHLDAIKYACVPLKNLEQSTWPPSWC